MKKMIAILGLVLMSSTAVWAKSLSPVVSPETEILRNITEVKLIPVGSYSARVITMASFSDPEQTYFLLISKDAGFDPEEENTSLFDLSEVIGTGAVIKNIKAVSETKLEISVYKHKKLKKIIISISGLSVSIP